MNRAFKGALWGLAAYAGLRLGARLMRRRWARALPPPEAETLLGLLGLEKGGHVLKLWAGQRSLTGPIAEAIGATGRLVAVDPDPAMLARLVEHVGDLSNLTVQVADPGDLPVPDATFDRVLMGPGPWRLPRPERKMQEAFRVLKPHGLLVVATDALDPEGRTQCRLIDLALAAGFVLRARRAGAWRSVLVFERPAAPSFLHVPHEEHRIETYG